MSDTNVTTLRPAAKDRTAAERQRRSRAKRKHRDAPVTAAVVTMAVAMEGAKLVTAGWLARRWRVTA